MEFDVDLDFRIPHLRALLDHTTRLPEEQVRVLCYDTYDLRLWTNGRGSRLAAYEADRLSEIQYRRPQDIRGHWQRGWKRLHHQKGHSWLG